jgi:hypothetical protein
MRRLRSGRNSQSLCFVNTAMEAGLHLILTIIAFHVRLYRLGTTAGVVASSQALSIRLTAHCRPEVGPNFRTTQIDVRACGAEVFNRDGGLQCYAKQSWGSGSRYPSGRDIAGFYLQHLCCRCGERHFLFRWQLPISSSTF